ncbi:Uncharacterised protein [Vibrio cholerae]|nr:Uncharacterised protein [Vibrio cholerae]
MWLDSGCQILPSLASHPQTHLSIQQALEFQDPYSNEQSTPHLSQLRVV